MAKKEKKEKKEKKSAGEWKTKTLAEVTINGQVWRAQKLKSPEGDLLFGVRAFYTKKDGTETITRHGFTLPKAVATKSNITQLNKLLKALHEVASDD